MCTCNDFHKWHFTLANQISTYAYLFTPQYMLLCLTRSIKDAAQWKRRIEGRHHLVLLHMQVHNKRGILCLQKHRCQLYVVKVAPLACQGCLKDRTKPWYMLCICSFAVLLLGACAGVSKREYKPSMSSSKVSMCFRQLHSSSPLFSCCCNES